MSSISKTDRRPHQLIEWQVAVPNQSRQKTNRNGSVSGLVLFVIVSMLVVVTLCFTALNLRPDSRRSPDSINQVRIYCAASVASPIESLVRDYNEAHNTCIEIVRTGGSGDLAGQIQLEFQLGSRHSADLYVSADDAIVQQVIDTGVVSESFVIARQRPVIAVQTKSRSFPTSLQEFANGNYKFGIASEQAAIGRIVRQLAAREGILERLESQKTTDAENVMTLGQALVAGSLDSAVIWDTTLKLLNRSAGKDVLKSTAFADPGNSTYGQVVIGVLSKSKQHKPSRNFCRFLAASTQSRNAFEAAGFEFASPDH